MKPTGNGIDAEVIEVEPYTGGDRKDVVQVLARFSFAIGAVWWVESGGAKIGDRYRVWIEKEPTH